MTKFPSAAGLVVPVACLLLAGCSEPVTPIAEEDGSPAFVDSFSGYTVHVDPDRPGRLLAELDLRGHEGVDRTVYVRGLNFGLGSQVSDPSCGGVGVELSENGQWQVPDDCALLSWFIDVDHGEPNTVDTSQQRSLFFSDRGWWLLSEPTSLLRIGGADIESQLVLRIKGMPESSHVVGASVVEEGVWRLPSVNNAPEFFAFGDLILEQHDIGPLHTTYVIDDSARFERMGLLGLHRKALAYLAEVFQVPSDLPAEDRHLLVVWLSIDESLGQAGGAAGSRSFLANYVDGDDEALAMNSARTMLILAHEQTHQLHDLTWQGGTPGPTWLGESIAHYYGLKALARSGLRDDVVAAAMDAFIDPEQPIEAGLVEYNRLFVAGDGEAYGMFYSQGATFWSEVDRVLLSASPESGGLDALIPAFVQSTVSGDALPPSFQRRLVEYGGAEMEELIVRYVGE